MALSRRALLQLTGGAVTVGVGGQTARCVAAGIRAVDYRIEDEFPHDEHVVVDVDVRSSIAPALRASIGTPDGRGTRTKSLSPERSSYRFGPFGHHTVDEYRVWLDGCL